MSTSGRWSGEVVEVLGVYDADGGLRGEVAHAVGEVLGRASCELCDITHSRVRRKPAWDALVRAHDVRVRVAHRNELAHGELTAVAGELLPVVLGRTSEGDWRVLLDAEALASLKGSVDAFDREFRSLLAG